MKTISPMHVLIAENSKTMSSLIMHNLSQIEGVSVEYVANMEELGHRLNDGGHAAFDLAISGIHFVGCSTGGAVELITEYQIPTIVFSGEYSEENRDRYLSMPGVIDYVVKENQTAMRYLCHMVYRLQANRQIKVLVVSDKKAIRLHVGGLLGNYAFQVLFAKTGQEALSVLENQRDIKMVVTSHETGPVSGLDLTKKIRETYDRDEMAIIGMSTQDIPTLSARFIKYGANDFIQTPFLPEEFLCRITMNIDMIENAKALFDMASKDYLTGLLNRRYFFKMGQGKLNRAHRQHIPIAVAMIDVDHFKSVNDTFGHDVGDAVLKGVAQVIKDFAENSDIVTRLGGEEFAIMLETPDRGELSSYFEQLRAKIEGTIFDELQDRRHVTASFGVIVHETRHDLDDLLKAADKLLYHSKKTGRNRVTIQSLDLLEAS